MNRLLLLVICFGVLSCTQDNTDHLTVKLDHVYDQPARGFTVLYPISEMADTLHAKIKFPELGEAEDTTYTTIYFTGKNKSALKNSVLALVSNHNSDAPSIWIDENNDLDFTDTNEARLFSENSIDISIPVLSEKSHNYSLRLFKPDSVQQEKNEGMIKKYITRGKPFAGFYFNQRRNIKVGDFKFGEDSLRIGIMDWNVNGAYNDLGEDRIVFGKYRGQLDGTEEASGAIVLDSTNYFQANTKSFEVTKVAPNGELLKLQPTLSSNVENRLTEGDAIPNFSFKLLSGDQKNINEYYKDQKFLYLNFWANWCSGCHEEIEELKKIHSEYSAQVKLISLNYNEETSKIESFLNKYNINWLNGYSTAKINQKLFVYGLPRSVLIDSTGTIIEMDIHPQKLLARLSNPKK